MALIPQLIVGLGNPGSKYDRTRHNIGFEAVDFLAHKWGATLSENRRFNGLFGEAKMRSPDKLYFLKPLTYMNRSGQAIRSVVDWYKLPPESVLVIYDDMDLPVGRLRLRLSGSAGGHNGMKSAIAHLGTQNFPRLRLGIDKPPGDFSRDGQSISHVLGKFSPNERQIMDKLLPQILEAMELALEDGVEKAMSLYNNRSVN